MNTEDYKTQAIALWTEIRDLLRQLVARKRATKPKAKRIETEDFKAFWSAYPRKEGKGAAKDAWNKYNPPIDAVLRCVAGYKRSAQWKKGKEWIPLPTTWLNQERWDDDPGYKPTPPPRPVTQAAKCEVCGKDTGVNLHLPSGKMLCRNCEQEIT